MLQSNLFNKRRLEYDDESFDKQYMSIAQILAKHADPTFLWCELGRGSGKTTHILAPRMDRVQQSLAGATLVLGSATYKSILDNIVPGIMEYFSANYQRGVYYEVGQKPPNNFAPCVGFVADWRHTISFASGTVIQFVSCDRPESMLGKNAAHLFVDEMLRISQDKFVERIIPALRSDRSRWGQSPYFMGITGTSSTPNFETDEDWWCKYEHNVNEQMIANIINLDHYMDIERAKYYDAVTHGRVKDAEFIQKWLDRWEYRLALARKGQTYYLRASSLSNIKILGLDYIANQMTNIKDEDTFNTQIFAIRKEKVKDRFFGKFGRDHIFDDSYDYARAKIDDIDIDNANFDSLALKYCNPNMPLYAGYDPGPFSSIVFAQKVVRPRELRVIKDFWVIHPQQHEELADKIAKFFKHHLHKRIFLHYDRAANQRDPNWHKYYPVDAGVGDTDALLLKKALEKRGWQVTLMSLNQATIKYAQHYRLLNILFAPLREGEPRDVIKIDENECEALVSSINHSPIKRDEGKILLDKSSEKKLEYEQQAYYSTQIATALMYLLWGEYNKLLPSSDRPGTASSGIVPL